MISIFDPKVYINGFPKSGLHMVESMIREISKPAANPDKNPWFGTFHDNSFTNRWIDVDTFIDNIPKILPGYYAKGHCGYTPEIASAFKKNEVAKIFVYRDMRDVIVSQAHHIRSDSDRFKHPDKGAYSGMSLEDTLIAVICGWGKFPGIYDRWWHYAPWLIEEGTLRIRFEEIKQSPYEMANLIVRYVYGVTASYRHSKVKMNIEQVNETVNNMVEAIQRKDQGTFRRGKSGTWREVWTKPVNNAFEAEQAKFTKRMEVYLRRRQAKAA